MIQRHTLNNLYDLKTALKFHKTALSSYCKRCVYISNFILNIGSELFSNITFSRCSDLGRLGRQVSIDF